MVGKSPVHTSSLDKTVSHLVTGSIEKPQAFPTEDSGSLILQPTNKADQNAPSLQTAGLTTGT